MRTAFVETLCELAERDERIWLLTGDLGFAVLERFATRFPEHFVNVGVAEQNMMGIAAGLALGGKIVFVYSIANFPVMRCLEQIRNDVCYHNLNVKIIALGGGLVYGAQGFTHYAIEDLAVLRALPNLAVLAPGDPIETRLATRAIAEWQGPCYMRLGKAGEPVVYASAPEFQIGKAIVVREGDAATLISMGGTLQMTVEASQALAKQNIQVRVLSLHTLKPIDHSAIFAAMRDTRAIVTVEEHTTIGGLGDAVAATMANQNMRMVLRRIALSNGASQLVGSQEYLRERQGLSAQGIVTVVKEMLASRRND
jgi:transketolase